MNIFTPFTPSTVAAFSFQPIIAGNQYTVTVTWNIFRGGNASAFEGYYANITDLSGNLVLCCPLVGGSPGLQASLTWKDDTTGGTATIVTAAPHNVPLAQLANVRVSNTGTAFDGLWQALSTGATTLTYGLSDPLQALPASGTLDIPLNLVAGVIASGWLYYHEDTLQFESESPT